MSITALANLSLRINSLIEYLQKVLDNYELFYKDKLTIFIMKVSNVNEEEIKERNFPSQGRIKQLKLVFEVKN